MQPERVLLLPGLNNSGPTHWQSQWQAQQGFVRVEQHDWDRPLRGDWIARLEEALLDWPTGQGPCTLVAHSLGCLLVAAWASHSHNTALVRAAMLVAPPDSEREELRPLLPSWAPVSLTRLPFPSVVMTSQNDPYCSTARAQCFARGWGAAWHDCGAKGHLNADSGLGDWPEGLAILQQLTKETEKT